MTIKPRSDRRDVHGLRSLVPLLGVVGDLGALLQRAVSLAVDAGVVHEQILVAVVGRDEPESLVVAEPLDGASWHVATPPRCVCCDAEDAFLSLDLRALALLFAGIGAGQTPRR